MRAAVMRGDGLFVVEDRPMPEPAAGNVLVRVRACGICGSDLHFFHHARAVIERPDELGALTLSMDANLANGPVLGHEFVCEVVDFGPQTQRTLEVGTRVVSMPFVLRDGAPVLVGSRPDTPGAYAEFMELTEALLLPAPDSVPDEAAALVEPIAVAVHAVNKAQLTGDETIALIGCGPIGLALAAVLRARGFRHITASDLSPRRRELAGIMGAEEVVDPTLDNVIARAQARAPASPLVVFENTGARGMLRRVVLDAPPNSQVIVTGIAAGDENFMPLLAVSKELILRFVVYYSAEEFAEALELIQEGRIDWRALITGKTGLAGVTQAVADLSDPERHAKILIAPWS
ncbi:MAG: zinc-binding dehydrogenase [Phenylobacterium sp.]